VTRAGLVPITPPLEREAVLRCLDYPPGRQPPARIEALLAEALAEARGLIETRGSWCTQELARCGDVGLSPVPAEGLVLGLVTIGPGLEQRVAALQAGGSLTAALVLDAVGSAAAEEAADLLSAHVLARLGLADDEHPPAGAPGCRLSPGYWDWSLDSQPALLDRLGAPALGVTLSAGMMMTPRKSISFAMWLGAARRPAVGLSGCRGCGLRRCRYLTPRSRSTP